MRNLLLILVLFMGGCAYNQGTAPDGAPTYSSAGLGSGDPQGVANAGYTARMGHANEQYILAEADMVRRYGQQWGTSDLEREIISINSEREPERILLLRREINSEILKPSPSTERLRVLREQLGIEETNYRESKAERLRVLRELQSNRRVENPTTTNALNTSDRPADAGATAMRLGVINYMPSPPNRLNLVIYNSNDFNVHLKLRYDGRGGSYNADSRSITPGRLIPPRGAFCFQVPQEGPYVVDGYNRDGTCIGGLRITIDAIKNNANWYGLQCDSWADFHAGQSP